MRETCSDGEIPAVKSGNASATFLTCPEYLLEALTFPQRQTSTNSHKLFATLKTNKEANKKLSFPIPQQFYRISVSTLSFGCFFHLYLELFVSFLGKVREMSSFAKTIVRLGKHFHFLDDSPDCSDEILLRTVQLENLSCADLLLLHVSCQVFPLHLASKG